MLTSVNQGFTKEYPIETTKIEQVYFVLKFRKVFSASKSEAQIGSTPCLTGYEVVPHHIEQEADCI